MPSDHLSALMAIRNNSPMLLAGLGASKDIATAVAAVAMAFDVLLEEWPKIIASLPEPGTGTAEPA